MDEDAVVEIEAPEGAGTTVAVSDMDAMLMELETGNERYCESTIRRKLVVNKNYTEKIRKY